jgi:dipeptidyl aminopeptidase/acylaminoacyl peptidase
VTVAPYGSWASPITADRLVEDAVSLGQVAVDGPDLYWNEGRPAEGGRQVIVRWTPGEESVDVIPPGFSARTLVHEYGGASFAVRDGVVWFANFDDQRVYRVGPEGGAPPLAVTPEPPSPRSVRFADFDVSPDGTRLAAVRERHLASGEVVNDLVLLAGNGSSTEPEVIAGGHDFYAAPRFGLDGRLAWLSWDHPNMPWDGTELWVSGRDTPLAGGPDESISQPRWDPDGKLWWTSDGTGFWNLYRDGHVVVEEDAEYSGPDWVFGQSTYTVLPDGTVVAARTRGGLGQLTVDGQPLATSYTSFSSVVADGADAVVAEAASARQSPAVVRIDVRTGAVDVIRRSRPDAFVAGCLSAPEPITFPTDGGLDAHALFYRPANPDFEGPADELPPLVVMSHGGPTSAAQSDLNLKIQYFTSRGLAVVDVDYGGSSGYGRAYRRRLDGQWGVVDVADCVNAARHLAAAQRVDGARMAIRGGSAGGFTTLCALTFSDVFAVGASFYGVADLASLAADTHKFESRYLDRLVGPWPEAADVYHERSPIHAADRMSAPVILFQGVEDKVVPPAQSEIMVAALRDKGLPVAYVTFEGEQHGFRKAETIVRAAEAELWFYGRILGFEPADRIEPVPITNW